MIVSREFAKKLLDTYEKAWVLKDPELIISIFHEDGIYYEYLLKRKCVGHIGIKEHWQKKVVEEQSKIEFKLLNLYVDKTTVIAEWDAVFYSNVEDKTIHLVEVGIFEIENDKVRTLREFWHSERLD